MSATKLSLRALSAFLIVSSMAVPRLTTPDGGIWALATLMLGVALLAGMSYQRPQDSGEQAG